MPELPEVENVVRDLRPKLCGKMIKRAEVANHSVLVHYKNKFLKLIQDKTIQKLSRRGKFILFDLSGNYEVLMHLGMTGQLLYRKMNGHLDRYAGLYTRLIVYLNDNIHELRFADMRRFGWVALRKRGSKDTCLIDNLGPDALTIDLKGFKDCISERKGTIKGLLLNQRVISGLGNIYTDESLFKAAIHPCRKGNRLSGREIERLHRAMQQVLTAAIRSGGSTIGTYRLPNGNKGGFQEQHAVYQREGKPCLRCGTPIVRISVSGRGTYLCPKCQDEN